jgi:hypothetical protein
MRRIIYGLMVVLMIGLPCEAQDANLKAKAPNSPQFQNAIASVLEAFDNHKIVALAEAHKLQEEHDFIVSLIQHPAFPSKVNDIVVEFGNALYQDILDRYIAGENVPMGEVRQVWRTTGFSPLAPWDAPVYERFFVTVRAVNQKLPTTQRLRVLAGDPPVNWNKSKEEIVAVKEQYPRDKHFAAIVAKEVIAKDRKALLLIGGNHIYRHSWNPYASVQSENVIDILDQRYPKATFVIFTHAYETRNVQLESRLASWEKPSFVLLTKSWLGELETENLLSQTMSRGFPDGKTVTVKINFYPGMKLGDLADAYLYFGDLETLTASNPTPEMYRAEPEYLRELQRRFELVSGGRKFPIEALLQEKKSNRYYTAPLAPPPPPLR